MAELGGWANGLFRLNLALNLNLPFEQIKMKIMIKIKIKNCCAVLTYQQMRGGVFLR